MPYRREKGKKGLPFECQAQTPIKCEGYDDFSRIKTLQRLRRIVVGFVDPAITLVKYTTSIAPSRSSFQESNNGEESKENSHPTALDNAAQRSSPPPPLRPLHLIDTPSSGQLSPSAHLHSNNAALSVHQYHIASLFHLSSSSPIPDRPPIEVRRISGGKRH